MPWATVANVVHLCVESFHFQPRTTHLAYLVSGALRNSGQVRLPQHSAALLPPIQLARDGRHPVLVQALGGLRGDKGKNNDRWTTISAQQRAMWWPS